VNENAEKAVDGGEAPEGRQNPNLRQFRDIYVSGGFRWNVGGKHY